MTIPLHCHYFALGSSQKLGYGNARDALRKHVDCDDKLRTQIEYVGQKRPKPHYWFSNQVRITRHRQSSSTQRGVTFCDTVGGSNKPPNAFAMHVDNDDSLKWGLTASLGRTQQTIFINKSGLYSLILSSNSLRLAMHFASMWMRMTKGVFKMPTPNGFTDLSCPANQQGYHSFCYQNEWLSPSTAIYFALANMWMKRSKPPSRFATLVRTTRHR